MDEQGRPHGPGPSSCSSLYLATCNLLLCHAQATDQTRPSQTASQPGPRTCQGPLDGGVRLFFFSSVLSSSRPLNRLLMGWKSARWWQAGIIQDKAGL